MKKENLQQKRNRLAKETCQELRIYITDRVVDQNFNKVYVRFRKWFEAETSKVKFADPSQK